MPLKRESPGFPGLSPVLTKIFDSDLQLFQPWISRPCARCRERNLSSRNLTVLLIFPGLINKSGNDKEVLYEKGRQPLMTALEMTIF